MTSICLVGGGPRATGLLERLGANLTELVGDAPLDVHVVDPQPPGSGRIWRTEQPSLLWMNSEAADVAMFPDASSTIAGPITPGPTLAEWVLTNAAELAADPVLTDEVRAFTPHSFASRTLQGRWLTWVFAEVLRRAPAALRVHVHRTTAVGLTTEAGSSSGLQRVQLADGTVLRVAAVVLLQGHLDTEAGPREQGLAAHAAANGLVHVPPGYTADLDPDLVPAGEDVLVSGLGLAFVDWLVLLCESRGGRFDRVGGRLGYTPSGREPHLLAGSRRGVPHHAKLSYRLPGPRPPLPRFLTAAAFPGTGPLDFARDVWPVASKELAYAHYHELLHAHPERTRCGWREFEARFEPLAWGSRELAELVAETVIDDADVLDLDRLDRALDGETLGDPRTAHERVLSHVRADLARRADPARSPDAAVFLALLVVRAQVAELVRGGRIPEAQAVRDVDGWLHGFFSSVASGPPPQRLEQVLAVAEAGVLRFLGPDATFGADVARGDFIARSARTGEEVHARTLVDARLPAAAVAHTTDALLRGMHERGEVVEPQPGGVPAGTLVVDAANRLVDAAGHAHPGRYALGPWVAGGAWAPAFPRPDLDAGFFRQNDALARAVLADHAAGRAELLATG